jgi:hypothetical protein
VGSGLNETECEEMMHLIKKVTTDYISVEGDALREFLYEAEGKKYHHALVNPHM